MPFPSTSSGRPSTPRRSRMAWSWSRVRSPRRSRRLPRTMSRRRRRGCSASSSRSTSSSSRSTRTAIRLPIRAFRPGCLAIRRRPACSASSRRIAGIARISITTRRCFSCSGSPGRASPCIRAWSRAGRHRTVASVCPRRSPARCGASRSSVRASSSRAAT
jgi:hypothetical protein